MQSCHFFDGQHNEISFQTFQHTDLKKKKRMIELENGNGAQLALLGISDLRGYRYQFLGSKKVYRYEKW